MQFKLISPYPTQRRYAALFILLHNKVFCICQAHCPQGDPSFLDYLNPCFNFFPRSWGFVLFKVCSAFSHFLFLGIVPSVISQLFSHKLPFCSELLISSLKVG